MQHIGIINSSLFVMDNSYIVIESYSLLCYGFVSFGLNHWFGNFLELRNKKAWCYEQVLLRAVKAQSRLFFHSLKAHKMIARNKMYVQYLMRQQTKFWNLLLLIIMIAKVLLLVWFNKKIHYKFISLSWVKPAQVNGIGIFLPAFPSYVSLFSFLFSPPLLVIFLTVI